MSGLGLTGALMMGSLSSLPSPSGRTHLGLGAAGILAPPDLSVAPGHQHGNSQIGPSCF